MSQSPSSGRSRASGDPSVYIVRTGVANVEAVVSAFRRLGRESRFAETPADLARADLAVLPGVGAFDSGMEALERTGLDSGLRRRVEEGRPTLAICLGLQLLCEGSSEAPGRPGLGCVRGVATRFPSGPRIPQLGWNDVMAEDACSLVDSGVAYYANSFRLREKPAGWNVATSEYGGPFVASIERGPILACQFHPELSGDWGRAVLARWLDAGAGWARASLEGRGRAAGSC